MFGQEDREKSSDKTDAAPGNCSLLLVANYPGAPWNGKCVRGKGIAGWGQAQDISIEEMEMRSPLFLVGDRNWSKRPLSARHGDKRQTARRAMSSLRLQ